MRILTYNVNSLPARLPRVLALLEALDPDVAMLQETKCRPEQFPHEELAESGYVSADQSGGRWAGVAVLGRASLGVQPLSVGLPGEPSPDQARWVEARVGDVTFVSTYVPNGQRVDSEPYREKLVFFERMADRAAELAADGPVVIGGDMNVCRSDADAWDPAALHGGTHATEPERERFEAVLDAGYADLFRDLHPDDPGFSWWDYRGGAFHKGRGLRIDLLLATADLGPAEACFISRDFRKPSTVPEAKPSDHAPLVADLPRDPGRNDAATDDAVAAVRREGAGGPSQLGLL